jgi:hypothetical protein
VELIGAALAVILLGERIQAYHAFGVALIAAGLALACCAEAKRGEGASFFSAAIVN